MMRKSSKAISLLLSGLMATSCLGMAALSASAAPVDSDTTGIMTLEERQAAGHQLVFFQFPQTVWGNPASVKYNARKQTANVFCNLYAIYGNTTEIKSRAWEAPSTSMMKDNKSDTLYYFDITESGQGEIEEGANYGILFSTKANAGDTNLIGPNTDGFQTSDLYFNYECLGDTYYVDEPAVTRENTSNSQKITFKAHSSNGIGKEIRKVTSLCAYLDGAKEGTTPNSVEMANQLKEYLPNSVNEPSFVWAKIQPILTKYGTTPEEVYDMYVEKFSDKLDEGVPYEHVDGVDDLKSDGTLKDVYRYHSITTVTVEDGVEQTKTVKYPTLDLVRERLNLPPLADVEQIESVEATLSGAVTAAEALPTAAGPVGANYSSEYAWAPADATAAYSTTYTLTVTFTANEGFEFTEATTAALDGGEFDTVALTDGKLVATKAFTTEEEPTTAPPEETTAPVEETTAPVEETTAPVEETTAPVEETTAPVEETTAPVEETTAPVEETTAPVEETTTPIEDVFVVAGQPADIFGTAWDASNEANAMTKNDDGTYTKEYTVDKAYTDVQFKVVKNTSDWIGDQTGNNVTFNLTGAGTFTAIYYPEENYAAVLGDIVEFPEFTYDTVYAVGNGEGNWLNGTAWDPAYAANEMTQVSEDVWEIEFANVPDGFGRQIKFAVDGAWTHNFGGIFVESGEATDAVYNGDNIAFDTDELCTVKAQLDLSNFDYTTKEGAKFTITIEYGEPAEVVGVIGDVNGDGDVTVEDATLIQRRAVELEAFDEVQTKLADVNGDGRISILDVTCVQKYVAEYETGTGNAGKTLLADGTIADLK